MSLVDNFYELVDKGRKGESGSVSLGLPKMEEYMEGYSQGTSFLIGAASGVGKSSFVLYSFIYKPMMSPDCEEKDLRWLMMNYEMTEEQILAKLLSIYVYETYGEILTFRDIFSRGKSEEGPNILSDDKYALIKECEPILRKFEERITFAPNARTYESFEATCFNYMSQFGEFENPFGNFDDNKFTPNNPKQIIGIITDHMNLVKGTPKKLVIDNISNCTVRIRNMCRIVSPINIMQLNRGGTDGARIKSEMLEPLDSDFKDSGTAYEDSHVVFTLFNPAKVDIKKHRDYDVTQLGNRYISIKCLKNRFGSSNVNDAVAYYGEICTFAELPRPNEIYNYAKYKNPDWLIAPDDKVEETNTSTKPIKSFKF